MKFTEFNLGIRATRRGSRQLEGVGQTARGQGHLYPEGLSSYLMSERNAKGC
ncbi:hypothetical protein [Ferrimicrobium acidiphilum]|jgi:hypothetical protein|uniref:Uncharacterized protein n=1 Tax=Ferrimicrobium acidiphilum DSM 19497 TaxID=1121877 RepID=A0A0D8FSY1_9ACTN|nr:hypothetical protein [Ferrimicrobium acidiphilum]KJE76064.1 hypothetical protein FEAC_21550 [Ferrimicrobium acidiphilum DSM 19497]MCL5052938.1 hypothetical protein [Gammaproteobacteria bacterium]